MQFPAALGVPLRGCMIILTDGWNEFFDKGRIINSILTNTCDPYDRAARERRREQIAWIEEYRIGRYPEDESGVHEFFGHCHMRVQAFLPKVDDSFEILGKPVGTHWTFGHHTWSNWIFPRACRCTMENQLTSPKMDERSASNGIKFYLLPFICESFSWKPNTFFSMLVGKDHHRCTECLHVAGCHAVIPPKPPPVPLPEGARAHNYGGNQVGCDRRKCGCNSPLAGCSLCCPSW